MNTSTVNSIQPQQAKIAINNDSDKGNKELKQKALRLQKACKDFQAIFLNHMLKTMRKTIPKSGFIDDGFGGEVFTEMFDAKLAESVSGNSGFGVDNALFNQLAPAALGKGWESEIGDLNYLQNKPIQSFYQKSESYGKYDSLIRSAGRRYNIAPGLIHAVINAESNEDSTIVSHKGAKGLMQLMDSTSTYLGVDDPFDPKQNIEAGTKYLRVLLDRFDGKIDLALAAYNSGPETVEKYGGIPPYRETENYVKSILQKLSMNESTTRSGT